jgi:hypothetical protein
VDGSLETPSIGQIIEEHPSAENEQEHHSQMFPPIYKTQDESLIALQNLSYRHNWMEKLAKVKSPTHRSPTLSPNPSQSQVSQRLMDPFQGEVPMLPRNPLPKRHLKYASGAQNNFLPDFKLSKNSSKANVGYYVHREKRLSIETEQPFFMEHDQFQSQKSLISKSYEQDTVWRYETNEPEIVR